MWLQVDELPHSRLRKEVVRAALVLFVASSTLASTLDGLMWPLHPPTP